MQADDDVNWRAPTESPMVDALVGLPPICRWEGKTIAAFQETRERLKGESRHATAVIANLLSASKNVGEVQGVA